MNWVGFDHVAGSLEMHFTPLIYGASQLHVHASAILSDPLPYLRLIEEKSIEIAFAPNFLLAKITRDLEKRTDLFGKFNLTSLRRINSGGEATCAGCIYDPTDVLATPPTHEFLELGMPIPGCEARIVNPEDGVIPRPDGQSGDLQAGWYRTGDVGIIENDKTRLSGRIKDTVIVHGVSYGIPELETHLQTVEGVTHSFLAAALCRSLPTHRALRDVSAKMITLPPQFIIPIPGDQMEGLAKHIVHAEEFLNIARGPSFVIPSTETGKILARTYANIFNLNVSDMSAGDNFFELGGTSIDVITLKREGETAFELPEISTLQILKYHILSSLAKYVDSLISKNASTEEYDPIVPLNLTSKKTPIFMVSGEVLIFVNLTKYSLNEQPFYVFRAWGFEPGHPFFGSMDEMVSSYAAAVKRTQPHGPYAITGYSYRWCRRVRSCQAT
ncbi:hypothetical protein J3R82DRAFT_9091 [Butyriboletus roseoflavus]|nr:hypothetical protein J3R82DRAFT_9091 [Butyriboletus roseoflavus]